MAETQDYNASRSGPQCYERRMDLAPAAVFDWLAAMQPRSESFSDILPWMIRRRAESPVAPEPPHLL